MKIDPATSLPGWQADRLAVLLDALDGVTISDAERASLAWLSGFEELLAPVHSIGSAASSLALAPSPRCTARGDGPGHRWGPDLGE
jgi:hypothetical protein